MNEVIKTILERRTIRKFQDRQISVNNDGRLEAPKYPNNAEKENSKQWRTVMRQIKTERDTTAKGVIPLKTDLTSAEVQIQKLKIAIPFRIYNVRQIATTMITLY